MRDLVDKFYPYAKDYMGFNQDVDVKYVEDEENSLDPLGKTAQYDLGDKVISVFVTGRHPKDVMRSISHELVHHTQNCRGEFDEGVELVEGYAQSDEHLREMEKEAYVLGNMCFRDWTDSLKQGIEEGEEMKIKEKKFEEIEEQEEFDLDGFEDEEDELSGYEGELSALGGEEVMTSFDDLGSKKKEEIPQDVQADIDAEFGGDEDEEEEIEDEVFEEVEEEKETLQEWKNKELFNTLTKLWSK